MGRKSETSVEDRKVVVKLALEGKSLREIGKIIGRSRSTIHGIVRKFMDYGITSNKQGRGRKPILNEMERRNILLEVLRDPHQSVPKLTSEIVARIGRPVSCVTVRRVVRSVKTVDYQGITNLGDSPSPGELNNAVDEIQREGDFPKKKVDRKKNLLYQNIRKQMEFYFSNTNLNKDHFFGKHMMKDPNINISIFLRLNKIQALTTDARDIVDALRDSELLSVTEDGTKVFCTNLVTQKENTDDSSMYTAMDRRLSSDTASQKLEKDKSNTNPNKEIRMEPTDGYPELKLQVSTEESDVCKPENTHPTI